MRDWRDEVRARLSSLQLSPTREAEIADELAQHLEDRYQELRSMGTSEEEALRITRREFGEAPALAEHMQPLRQSHTPGPTTPPPRTGHRRRDLWEHARFVTRSSMRALRQEFGFSLAAIVILTLGLAVNATAFRLMDATLFHGYPLVQQNNRMVFIDERFPYPGCCVSYADFDAWRTQARSFQGLTFGVFRQFTLSERPDDGRDTSVCLVSPNAFRVLGVVPALGRDFRPSEDAPGSPPVVIVSHQYWMRRWAGRADIIGSAVRLNDTAATIVGVMPQGFQFPGRTDVWMPLADTADLHHTVANGSFVFGRLAEGVTESAARAEVEAINARLAIESPSTNQDVRPLLSNFMDAFAGPNASIIYGSIWAGAWLVLTIAWANVANLALARSQRRTREMCTRLALGASRGQLAFQWFLDSVMLSAIAGLLAWWLVAWSTELWTRVTTMQGPVHDYTPNASTLAYVAVIVLATALAITVAPVTRLWRLELNGALKAEPQGATINLRARRLSAALVTSQMMLAIVLMSGAGVLGRSLWNVLRADVGVQNPEQVLIGKFELPTARYATPDSRGAFVDALRARLAGVPGVVSAAVANGRPVDDHEPQGLELDGRTDSRYAVPVFRSGPGYFQTIGAPMVAGRDVADTDRAGTLPVVVVNHRFAETYFPGRPAIGERIRLHGKREAEPDAWRTIVGVVSDVMQNDAFRQRFHPAVYVPIAQQPSNSAWFFVRVQQMSDGVAMTVRDQAQQVDANLEILSFSTLKATLGFGLNSLSAGQGSAQYQALARHAAVAPLFAGIALLLAAAGLYAVVARAVGQRTKEIGVRVTLGAPPSAIRRLVLVDGMAPVATGLMLGLIASLAVNRVLQAQLFGVSPYDALTLTVAPAILLVIALLGCLIPLRQAVRLDPAVALRRD